MKISVKVGNIKRISCDLLIVSVFKGVRKLSGAAAAIDSLLRGVLSEAINRREIEGKLSETALFHTQGRIGAKRVLVVGLGEKEKFDYDAIRAAAAAGIREAKKIKAQSVVSILHGAGRDGLDPKSCAEALVEGTLLGNYKFYGYKEKKEKDFLIKDFVIVEQNPGQLNRIKQAAGRARIWSEAQNNARDLVNAPANLMNPSALAEHARKMAKSTGIKCRILDPHKLGFGAMLSVSRGSKDIPKVVVLTYKHGSGSETIGLVGKGITFDSGGISIKPSNKLWEMKTDMAGAAAVIETMRAARELGVKKNIIAVVPLCENMPDGDAARPGDVVTSFSGKTIEIISTDAEGRMLLIDAINYAQQLGATKIVDVATLTGGCVVALGDVAAGIMGNGNHQLVEEILEASKASGEKMWQLPLYEEYKEYLKSDIADIKNASEGRGASPSTGGIFVQEIVGKTPWAHIDIAGTAYLHHKRGYLASGATGTPVRTLVRWLCS